jgi:hypothetical protein
MNPASKSLPAETIALRLHDGAKCLRKRNGPYKRNTLENKLYCNLCRFPYFCVFLIPVHTLGVLVYSCVEWCSNSVSQRLVWFPLLVGAVSKSLIKHSGNVFIKVINKRCTTYIVWSNFIPLEIITRTSVQYLL